jgi:putative peptide zinc metalloprotease protein
MDTFTSRADRRKQVRLRLRSDLKFTEQRYEGKLCHVVKDPVSLRYYRFNDQEYFVVKRLDGKHTLEDTQKEFERQFRPHRLSLEDLEGFARQLLSAGLVQHESSHAAGLLLERRQKQRFMQKLATWTNILYIKIPLFDPDRLLSAMLPYLWWVFTRTFLACSVGLMLAAVLLVVTHFQTFYDKLPAYHEFFRWNTLLYMWIALGIVKVIHEFGHGLSCKAFGGECHEMGALIMCFSPALYCNVTDSWTVPDKWKRIIISFAGIYVELVIAAIATFVWWNTPGRPFINNVALCVMVLCSVSTFVFNANPLMRFDGYYMLADWLEIPNLRERANRILTKYFQETCLGIEVQPEPYMEPGRWLLFITYAIVSYIYRYVVTFGIIWFLAGFLKPYKLGSLSVMLAIAALASMIFWPMYRMVRDYNQRGRLPDMKTPRVVITSSVAIAVVLGFFLLPLPVSRIHTPAMVQVDPSAYDKVFLPVAEPATLDTLYVRDGQIVQEGQLLAEFRSRELEDKLLEASAQVQMAESQTAAFRKQLKEAGGALNDKNLSEVETEMRKAEGDLKKYAAQKMFLEKQIDRIKNLTAPRAGVVMSAPRKNDIGKQWEIEPATPVCSIGEQTHLRVMFPVSPADYRLLKDNLAASPGQSMRVPVSVHVPGRTDRNWEAWLTQLPESEAKDVPVQLTQQCGGPLAVKPGQRQGVCVPQAQQYLVVAEFKDPDFTVCPGTLVQIKVHCSWRTAAWWTWRAISSALDLGLI